LCGIVGFTHRSRVLASAHIRNAVRALIHRGPDQQGIYESEDISLGGVRLKIIDLAGGDQPVSSEDGDMVLVFNGEIYNHAELRTELAARGCRFRSRSDTEVVLQAFQVWDTDCFRRFRGMFALGIWTESHKRLVLARDHAGIKPLFIHRTGAEILFGSEIKALFEHPTVQRKINTDALDCFLSLNYVPAPLTMVDGIHKLPPGYFLEWIDGHSRQSSYWSPAEVVPRRCTLEDAKHELDGLLRQSIREHLVSDVPLGMWASGGLDSSTIVHYAAEAGARPKAFSITFNGRSFDESRYIREVARHYGVEYAEFDLNTDVDLTDAIEQFAYYSDEPCADAGALPVWFLAKMTRREATVALSGEGADELFGGYITYQADRYAHWLRSVLPVRVRRSCHSIAQHWPVSDEKISFEYKLKRFLYGSLLAPEHAHVFWNGTFSDEEKRRLLYKADGPMGELLGQVHGRRGLNRYLEFDFQYYLPDDILCKVDRMSMAHSLEVRPPFLDRRICEFALSLPEELKIRRSQLKFVLRELMKGKLPPSILRRKKVGFDIPVHEWLRGALKPLLLDTITESTINETGLFRWPAVESFINDHLERRANWGYHLWGLMVLVQWMNRWNVHAIPSSSLSSPRRSTSVVFSVLRT
jgi:asparagine synthase (glutamine-hydrolysing)